MTTSNSATDTRYFNDSLTCVGYFNRFKLIDKSSGNKGQPYISVTFCKFSGASDNTVKTYIDLIVRGERAKELLSDYAESINSKTPVFASIRCSDLTLDTYKSREGEIKPKLQGRLLDITYLKVGHEIIDIVVKAPADMTEPEEIQAEDYTQDPDLAQ